MKNAYKVIVKNAQGSAKTLTHDVPAPGSFWGPLKIKAAPGARYQLVDVSTGQGPDNIRVKRVGKDLRISFEGRDTVDVMITDYYEHAGNESLVGEVDAGVLHAYVPETGDSAQMLSRLTDGAKSTGMALGSEQLAGSGAAVGALAAAAGVNPLVAAPLALLGAGGGGGGGGVDVTPPNQPKAKLDPKDDTGILDDDAITSDRTPKILIDADADAVSATLTINGKTYTSTEKINGQFVVQIPDEDALGHGAHAYTVVVKDAARNQSPEFKGSLTVLTNVQPPENLVLKNLKLAEGSDSGKFANDFLTNKQKLKFSGEVEGFDSSTQRFLVQVLNDAGDVLSMRYVDPAAGKWAFDNSTQALGVVDKTKDYLIKTSVVDLAGNILKSTSQSFVVDLETPVIKYPNFGSTEQSSLTIDSFQASEKGAFKYGGTVLNADSVEFTQGTFQKNEFNLNFTDLAGNETLLTNVHQPWIFQNNKVDLFQGPSAGQFITRADSVGKYELEFDLDTLDVSSLYDTRPTVGEKAAINHISTVGHGPDAITISMDDVLALGVKNSFTTSGKLQMRIDRDADDQVFLDNKMGSSSDLKWMSPSQTTLDGRQYSVYVNTALGLELFIQQGIPIQADGVL